MRPRQVKGVRQRAQDGARDVAPRSDISVAEWLDGTLGKRVTEDNVTPLYTATDRPHLAAPLVDGNLDHTDEFRPTADLNTITSQLDELARELDRRKSCATDAEITTVKRCLNALARQIDARTAQAADQGDEHFHPQFDAPARATGARPPVIRLHPRQSEALEAGIAAVSILVNSMGPRRNPRPRRTDDQAVSDGFRRKPGELQATGHLSTITSRLDALARNLDRRKSSATEAQIMAVRYCLDALASRIDTRVATDGFDPAIPPDERQLETPSTGHAAGKAPVKSAPVSRQRRRRRMPDHSLDGKREHVDTSSSRRDRLPPVAAPDRQIAKPNGPREQTPPGVDHLSVSPLDRMISPIFPQIHPLRRDGAINAKPARSSSVSKVIVGLAAILVATIAVVGAHFVGARMTGQSVVTPVMVFLQENAAAVLKRVTSSLRRAETPRRAVAQQAPLPLPELYGVYAVSDGQLIELEALPGQVPDQRIAMSGAISRPSRVTLPDGPIAFIVFRRDVASNISERVPIRVIARVQRAIVFGRAGEPRKAEVGDTWTIRNISYDFRVAPMDHNKEMVLVRPESVDFTLPSGRYALVLKGQAYDFTVDGPVTEPAQCLERVEAANGSFYHECPPTDGEAAGLPSPGPPPSPDLAPAARRQAAKLR